MIISVQKILTAYGCNIRTRLGVNEVFFGEPAGLIILELKGEEKQRLLSKKTLKHLNRFMSERWFLMKYPESDQVARGIHMFGNQYQFTHHLVTQVNLISDNQHPDSLQAITKISFEFSHQFFRPWARGIEPSGEKSQYRRFFNKFQSSYKFPVMI